MKVDGLALHLKKLCVGVSSVDELESFTKSRRESFLHLQPDATEPWFELSTRNTPKRAGEILSGGSLYWVINKKICVRQRILALTPGVKDSGKSVCLIRLELKLIPVIPTDHRPFQGWRYLENKDSPPDIGNMGTVTADLPPHLLEELHRLGLV